MITQSSQRKGKERNELKMLVLSLCALRKSYPSLREIPFFRYPLCYFCIAASVRFIFFIIFSL
jgi:hypothetical protein